MIYNYNNLDLSRPLKFQKGNLFFGEKIINQWLYQNEKKGVYYYKSKLLGNCINFKIENLCHFSILENIVFNYKNYIIGEEYQYISNGIILFASKNKKNIIFCFEECGIIYRGEFENNIFKGKISFKNNIKNKIDLNIHIDNKNYIKLAS